MEWSYDGASVVHPPAGFTAPPIAAPPSGCRRRRRRWSQGSPDARVTGELHTGTDGKHRCPQNLSPTRRAQQIHEYLGEFLILEYMVFHQLADLGGVELDLRCSTHRENKVLEQVELWFPSEMKPRQQPNLHCGITLFRNCSSQPHKTFPKRIELSRQQRSFPKGFVRLIGPNSETKKLPASLLGLQTVLMAAASALWFSLWLRLTECTINLLDADEEKDEIRPTVHFLLFERFRGKCALRCVHHWLMIRD